MGSQSPYAVSIEDKYSLKSRATSTASSAGPTPDSSNVTTPASEFPCHSEVNIGSDDASIGSTEERICIEDTITKAKTRSLSKTFKQATTFAQNLVTPPKRLRLRSLFTPSQSDLKSDCMPASSSAPFIETKTADVDAQKLMFTIPNKPLCLKRQQSVEPLSPQDGLIPGHNTPEDAASMDIFEGPRMQDPHSTPVMPCSSQTYIALCAIRIAFFVPWCFAIGGAILLFPQYLDLITFKTGYMPPPELARRFAYWAQHAWQFIVIFLGIVAAISYCEPARGITFSALAMARFFYVWSSFKFDQSVPLGQDDRQSIYMALVMKDSGIGKDTLVLTRSENGTLRSNTVTCI